MKSEVAEETGSGAREQSTARAAIAMYIVLLTAYALMAADRFLFPVLAPNVRQDFGFSLAGTGLLSTIFTLGLGVGGLPTGFLLSRFSRKTVLMAGIAIFSAATALTAVATGFYSLLVYLALTGIGMAMLATVMFSLAAAYFYRNRGAAIGSVNLCYGIGGMVGPTLAGVLLVSFGSWRIPMAAFGLFGFVMIAVIAVAVRPWFSETRRAADVRGDRGGASSLLNRNTVILTVLSGLFGLILYGFLGMYPTFLRESLQYAPATAGFVMSFFGLGALASIGGGWLGDRFSPRLVMAGAFVSTAILGYLLFHGSPAVPMKALLVFVYGVIGSAVLYVNLAAYHVKAVRSSLASRGSGMFVTSFYAASAIAGSLMGWLANQSGWIVAGQIQISLLSILAAGFALALRGEEMSR